MTKLNERQSDAMRTLSNHVGQTVDVLTSQHTANVAPAAVANSVGTINSATLRGLQAKGMIRIEATYWKGATITVLKGA